MDIEPAKKAYGLEIITYKVLKFGDHIPLARKGRKLKTPLLAGLMVRVSFA